MPTGSGGLFGVSCTGAGDCTAVGGGGGGATYAIESGGTWGTLTTIVFPDGGQFSGVSCSDAADCTAVGVFGNPDEAGYAIESDGAWGPATQDPPGTFNGVSCSSATDCTAVGYQPYVLENMPIYATTETTDTVAFVTDGGAAVSSVSGPDGSSITCRATPTPATALTAGSARPVVAPRSVVPARLTPSLQAGPPSTPNGRPTQPIPSPSTPRAVARSPR